MKIFNKNIHWSTPGNYADDDDFYVDLEFSDDDIRKIDKLYTVAREYDAEVRIDFPATYSPDLEEDFRPGIEKLCIMSNGDMYYHASSRYDASHQIESESISINELFN